MPGIQLTQTGGAGVINGAGEQNPDPFITVITGVASVLALVGAAVKRWSLAGPRGSRAELKPGITVPTPQLIFDYPGFWTIEAVDENGTVYTLQLLVRKIVTTQRGQAITPAYCAPSQVETPLYGESTFCDETKGGLLSSKDRLGRIWSLRGSSAEIMDQLTWFIDEQNSTGLASDSNDGETAATPLLTDAERVRRMGLWPSWVGTYHLRYLSDTNGSIYLGGDRTNATIFVHGSAADGVGQSTLYAGTIDAITNLNRTAANGGQPIEITSNDLPVSWAASDLVFRRIRRVSDGATAWVMKDLGSKKCRSSEWTIGGTFTAPFTVPATAATPIAGDSFVVERLTKIKSVINNLVGRTTANFQGVNFESVDLGDAPVHGYSQCAYAFIGCIYRNAVSTDFIVGSINFSSCRLVSVLGLCFPAFSLSSTIQGGTIDDNGEGSSVVQLSLLQHGAIRRVMTQNINVIMAAIPAGGTRGGWSVSQLGIFDAWGSALEVDSPMAFFISSGLAVLWGSGSAGVAIAHRAQGSWGTAAPLALGTNLNLAAGGGSDISFPNGRTSVRVFDDSTGAYTAARALSFANLIATIASGGFASSAGIPALVDPVSGCAIVSTSP